MEKRVFTDEMKLKLSRIHPGLPRWVLIPRTDVLRRDRGEDRYTEDALGRGWERPGRLESPEAGRGKGGALHRAFRGGTALLTPPFQTFGLPDGERINSCCFTLSVTTYLSSTKTLIHTHI